MVKSSAPADKGAAKGKQALDVSFLAKAGYQGYIERGS